MRTFLVCLALVLALSQAVFAAQCRVTGNLHGGGGSNQNRYQNGQRQSGVIITGNLYGGGGGTSGYGYNAYGAANYGQGISPNSIIIDGTGATAFEVVLANRCRSMLIKIGLRDGALLTGIVNVKYEDRGLVAGGGNVQIGRASSKVTVTSHLELVTEYDAYLADVTMSRNISQATSIQVGRGGIASGNNRDELGDLLYDVAYQGLTNIAAQVAAAEKIRRTQTYDPYARPQAASRDYQPAPIQPRQPERVVKVTGQVKLWIDGMVDQNGRAVSVGITIPDTKPVGEKDQIWFVAPDGQTIVGKFRVTRVNQNNLGLEKFEGKYPSDGDGFAIILTN